MHDKQPPMPRVGDQAVAARSLRVGPSVAVGEGKQVEAEGQAFEEDSFGRKVEERKEGRGR